MASQKDIFEPHSFGAASFACGTWRGLGSNMFGWVEYVVRGRVHYQQQAARAHYEAQGRSHYKSQDERTHYQVSGRTHYGVPAEDT